MVRYVFPLFVIAVLGHGCQGPPAERVVNAPTNYEVRDDLRHLYTDQGVSGSFILHDAGTDHWLYIDSAAADSGTLPASTFKIFSTLYALETGIATDADFVIPWDGVDHGRPAINKDLTLREAYDLSAYWYHREIARRAGPAVLKHWMDTVGYGNADTSGGFDKAWVAGNLRITPRQQIAFLENVQREELPFSERTYEIAKAIMVREDTLGHVLRAKTGWADGPMGNVGWYVGWVEAPKGQGPYFFANRLVTTDTVPPGNFGPARINIAMEVLKREGMWPE